ncbi:transcription factor FapR [Natronospora cellulosivora (SeqCode)]
MKMNKKERQTKLNILLEENPLLTDKQLSERFNVSIQTIRLDRLEMGIPEVRERTKNAASAYARLKSVSEGEVIGDLIALELDNYAESILITTQEMALQRSKIIRGHYLFAQANSLAVAVVDASNVLTGMSNLNFHQPVHINDKIRARAEVIKKEKYKYDISVKTYIDDLLVFEGDFIIFAKREV